MDSHNTVTCLQYYAITSYPVYCTLHTTVILPIELCTYLLSSLKCPAHTHYPA